MAHPATDEFDPSYLRFGARIVLKSCVKPAGCVQLLRTEGAPDSAGDC